MPRSAADDDLAALIAGYAETVIGCYLLKMYGDPACKMRV